MPKIHLPISDKDVIYRGAWLADEFELERAAIDSKYETFWRSWRRLTIVGEKPDTTWEEFTKWDILDIEYLIVAQATGDVEGKRKHLPQLFKTEEPKVEPKAEPTE